ncbi:hypothetical protein [Chthonobacter rhizosphaerae]|uniref:hypothetical protein n=1 Tax=Chthonobacter rhizosphaerae TaxID=2735553 RepID=UPI0015EEA031|nr:hypothetical protein [Chthonobacter rhizosphaerae]
MTKDVTTTARLRHGIDSTESGDKVAFPDPAASPLGTDDEAAGRPPTADAVREAASHELRGPAGSAVGQRTSETGRAISGEPGRTTEATTRASFVGPLIAVLVLAALMAVFGFWLA